MLFVFQCVRQTVSLKSVLTCERGLAQLTGGGARGAGRLVQLQLSLHWELWDGEGQLITPRAPHCTRTEQAGTLPTSSCTWETNKKQDELGPGLTARYIQF